MTRFYIRLAVLPVLLFTVVVLLIHIQLYDDHELRQILSPRTCSAPCFLGIRPGVTTVDEALKILKATGWTEQIDQYSSNISIKWNDNSPAWLSKNRLFSGTVFWIDGGLVTQFILETNLMIGDIQLSLGQPPFQHISLNYFNGYRFLFYAAVYRDEAVNVSTSHDCNNQAGKITYLSKVYLNYSLLDKETDLPPTYHDSWFDVVRTSCH